MGDPTPPPTRTERPAGARVGAWSYTIVGVLLAAVGFGAVFAFVGSGGAGGHGTQVQVVVAAHDIAFRTGLTTDDVTTIRMDSTYVPPGSFQTVSDVKGLVATISIAKGQPILTNMLVRSSDAVTEAGSAFLPIPKGFVAVTIATGEQQGVAGFIQPGDYITMVVAFIPPNGGSPTDRTVFNGLHVIRVGPATAQITPAGSGAPGTAQKAGGVSSSLTVVVTQCDAEFIRWFQVLPNGSITYTLLSFKDYQPPPTAPDPACASVQAAGGVTKTNVNQRWPGLLG